MLQDEHPDRDDLKRFIDEAQITASLTHPHVLPIYDIDMASDGRIYFDARGSRAARSARS